jgi:tRNA1Val (adenine37-N6)-methyltransferase
MIHPDETLDALFGGRLRILQKRHGYRFAMDPVLLAHFASPLRGKGVIDLGTGSGLIPMILAVRGAQGEIVGLEVQEDMVDMARRSIRLNGLEGRIRVVLGDYRRVEQLFAPQSFRHVVSNPPYHVAAAGRASSVAGRAMARQEISGTMDDLLRAARHLLGTKGRLWLSYPPARLPLLLEALRREGFEPKAVRMVHGRSDLPARVALVEAVRGGRPGLRVPAPLILYRSGRVYTEELTRIYEMI